MQRDRLLLAEALDAAQRIVELTAGKQTSDLETDRTLRDALLWNYTVLGEALSQLSDAAKSLEPASGRRTGCQPGQIRDAHCPFALPPTTLTLPGTKPPDTPGVSPMQVRFRPIVLRTM